MTAKRIAKPQSQQPKHPAPLIGAPADRPAMDASLKFTGVELMTLEIVGKVRARFSLTPRLGLKNYGSSRRWP